MIRLRQIKLNIEENESNLVNKISKILNIPPSEILEISIIKKSIDARKKDNLFYVYEVDIKTNLEEKILSKNK